MKLALISDVHANLEALRATLADVALHSADRVVCLGDIVGYNSRPAECIRLIRQADALCIAGNHDMAVCGRMRTDTFGSTAARAVAWTRQRLAQDDLDFLGGLPLKAIVARHVIAVHGALHAQADCASVRLDTDERRVLTLKSLMADPSGARICAFGHTHEAAVYEWRNLRLTLRTEPEVRLHEDAYYLINPGTVGEPRALDRRASYMMLDLTRRTVALRRVVYDSAAAFAATRRAGLAPALAFLPAPVRGAIGKGLRTLRLNRPARRIAASLGL